MSVVLAGVNCSVESPSRECLLVQRLNKQEIAGVSESQLVM